MREYTSSLASRVEQLSEEQEIARAAGETSTAAAPTPRTPSIASATCASAASTGVMRSRVDSLQVPGSALAITAAHHRPTTSTSRCSARAKGRRSEQQALLRSSRARCRRRPSSTAPRASGSTSSTSRSAARYQPPYPTSHHPISHPVSTTSRRRRRATGTSRSGSWRRSWRRRRRRWRSAMSRGAQPHDATSRPPSMFTTSTDTTTAPTTHPPPAGDRGRCSRFSRLAARGSWNPSSPRRTRTNAASGYWRTRRRPMAAALQAAEQRRR